MDPDTGASTDELPPGAVQYLKQLGLEVKKANEIAPKVPEVLDQAIKGGISKANGSAVSNAAKVKVQITHNNVNARICAFGNTIGTVICKELVQLLRTCFQSQFKIFTQAADSLPMIVNQQMFGLPISRKNKILLQLLSISKWFLALIIQLTHDLRSLGAEISSSAVGFLDSRRRTW